MQKKDKTHILNLIFKLVRAREKALKYRRNCNEFKKLCAEADSIYIEIETKLSEFINDERIPNWQEESVL